LIGTLAVDGWAVTFGAASRELGGAAARPVPSSLYQRYSEERTGWGRSPLRPLLAVPNITAPPINGQCTNFVLFDVHGTIIAFAV